MATSSEFWTSSFGGSNGETSAAYELLNGRSPARNRLMAVLRKAGMKEYGELLSTLLEDSSPATSASVTTSQVTASATPGGTNSQGGVVTVAAVEKVGLTINSDKDDASANTTRAVSAADVTAMQEELIMGDAAGGHGDRILTAPSDGSGVVSYPTDAAGNGGGGKQDTGR